MKSKLCLADDVTLQEISEIINLPSELRWIMLSSSFFTHFLFFLVCLLSSVPFPCTLGSNRLLWRFVAMEIFCTGAHTEILHFGSLLRVRARVLGNVPYGSSLTYVKKGQKAWIMVHNMEKFERWLSSWDSSYDKDSFLG